MKKLSIVLLLAISMVACQKKSDKTVVTGKIENYNGMPLMITGSGFEKDLTVNPDGSFTDTLALESNYYTLQGKGRSMVYVPLYLTKGDVIHLDIDFAGMPLSVKVSGKDSLASAYLQEKSKLRMEVEQGFQEAFMQQPAEFKTVLDNAKAKYNELLDKTKGLSSEFVNLEKKGTDYYMSQLKMIYPIIHERFAKEAVELPEDFKNELDKINYDLSSEFDKIPAYKELVMNHFSMELNQLEDDALKPFVEKVRALKSDNIKGEVFKIAGNSLSAANSREDNALLYNSIIEFVKDSAFLGQIEKRNAKLQQLYPGNPSPTFDFENFKGGSVSLESLKGKLVYIDVWATWCGPCIQEIPALQALEKEYHGKDIAFVSISIDQNKEAWDNFMKQQETISGIQLYADLSTEDNFADKYDIMYIPRFILIDKEGNIINANAPRPSEEGIKGLLNANL